MSTKLLLTATSLLLAAIPAATMAQNGVGPGKLTGPGWLSLSKQAPDQGAKPIRLNKHTMKLGYKTIYWYEVELNTTSTTNTTVYLTDTANKLSKPSSVTVAAGNLTESFWVVPISEGTTTLRAYNANRSVEMLITIEY